MPNQSFTDPVLYGRPRPCRTKSESQASTSQLRQADRRQGKRKALARPSSAKARAGHPPRQAPARENSRHNSARQTGAKANARRSLDQAAPRQSQDTLRDKQRRGKLPPSKHPLGETPATTRQADRRQGKRKALARPNSAMATAGHPSDQAAPGQSQDTHRDKQRRANPSGQATPDQTAPGIQTEIASPQGDRRFQLQRSGTISSGPLKKLRVSCVHERDGKQVPCVRSLCSYARENRAC